MQAMTRKSAAGMTPHRLSEGEMIVLRDEALSVLKCEAREHANFPQEQPIFDRMLAAAEVYGACSATEPSFADFQGKVMPVEEADELWLTDRAMIWLARLSVENRKSMEDGRGTVESNIESSPRHAYLQFVLDGILADEAVA
jgi:hypothetical protein